MSNCKKLMCFLVSITTCNALEMYDANTKKAAFKNMRTPIAMRSNLLEKKEKKYSCCAKRAKKVMNEVYKNINGFLLESGEYQEICNKGGAPTYGEITFEGLDILFNKLQIKSCDVFCDLGSGVGKTCVQAVLATPMRKSIGIELSSTRHNQAQKAKARLQRQRKIGRIKKLEFYEQDIVQADIHDATIIYMASTCFSPQLMQQVTDKLAKETKDSIRITTLRQLPQNDVFVQTNVYQLPMTWSAHTTVYVYERKNNKS